MSKWIEQIVQFQPECGQEETDKQTIIQAAQCVGNRLLSRETLFAHITCSAFVVNSEKNRVLLVYHKLRQAWSWPGGHIDGDKDLLAAAIRETVEETGVQKVVPFSDKLISLDIFPVKQHMKNGQLISPHLHFSAAYCLMCDENQATRHCPGENLAVAWVPFSYITNENFTEEDTRVYQKIIQKVLKRTNTELKQR